MNLSKRGTYTPAAARLSSSLLFLESYSLKNMPKALANFSPGFERSENPGYALTKFAANPERVPHVRNPFRVVRLSFVHGLPRVLTAFEPGAEISQRLRRIFQTLRHPCLSCRMTGESGALEAL